MRKKRLFSCLALLLAAVTLFTSYTEPASAAYAITSTEDSGCYWDSSLPKDGDKSYRSDSGWYRLVLTWDYAVDGAATETRTYATTLATSSGTKVNIAETEDGSWPTQRWYGNNFYESVVKSFTEEDCTFAWPDTTISTQLYYQSVSDPDDTLFQSNEYTPESYYSLYVKYAGKSERTGEDCWYISPCDDEGDRAERLWATDCHLDVSLMSDHASLFSGYEKQLIYPWTPDFSLLMPSYDVFENSEVFKYAAVTHAVKAEDRTGVLLADYHDNEKWYIRQNSDGSVSVQSAGYITYDFANDDEFLRGYESKDISAENNFYWCLCVFSGLMAAARYGNMEYSTFDNYGDYLSYLSVFFLTYYAENLFITPASSTRNVTLSGMDGVNFYKPITQERTVADTLYLSYNMRVELNTDNFYADVEDYPDFIFLNIMMLSIFGTTVKDVEGYPDMTEDEVRAACATAFDSEGNALSSDEILDSLLFKFVGDDFSGFSGLYVGTPIHTEYINPTGEKYTVAAGTVSVLGTADRNGDGVCEGIGYIGNINAVSSSSNTNILVEKGATLQIDGPTFASCGQTIVVKGSLVINSGAYLSPWRYYDYQYYYLRQGGINLVIDGGSVFVSTGAGLNLGCGNLKIINNGTLTNAGTVVQDISSNMSSSLSFLKRYSDSMTGARTASMLMESGTVENLSNAWFICGAEVYENCMNTLLKSISTAGDDANRVADLLSCMDDILLYCCEKGYSSDRYASVRLASASGEEKNIIRNYGGMMLLGAVKSTSSGSNRSTINSQTDIIRLRDLYVSGHTGKNSNICYHSKHLDTASGTWDSLTETYYDYTGISYSESVVYGDPDADTKAKANNIYALRVGTGSQGTSAISYFKITYVGTDGNKHTETISPSNLKQTYTIATGWQYCGVNENLAGDSCLCRNSTAAGSSAAYTDGESLSGSTFPDALDSMTDRIYLFQALYPISYVESISFNGSGSGSWTCTALNVYEVAYLFPVQEYGYASEDWYVPFSGTLIAETALSGAKDGIAYQTFVWDSETVEIGTGLYQLNVYTENEDAKTQTDRTGFAYYNVSSERPRFATDNAEYTFVVSLADNYSAGVESLYAQGTRASLTGGLIPEGFDYEQLLTMSLTYMTTDNVPRTVEIPVSLDALMWTWDTLLEEHTEQLSTPLHGLFQQGEEFVFRGYLPDFAYATEATLSYGEAEGSIAIASIAIHNASYASVSVQNGKLVPDYPISAVSYYTASSTEGTIIDAGMSLTAEMKSWNGTDSIYPKDKGSLYLVVVQTDDMDEASTVNDVYVQFTYENLQNIAQTTDVYALRDKVNDYYGYWLSDTGVEECGYATAMSSGNQIFFVINVSGAYRFTEATFEMEKSDNLDAWQMSSISIYDLEELGSREVSLGTVLSTATLSTNRIYYRDNIIGTGGVIASASGTLMIDPGEQKTISLSDGGVSGGGTGGSKNNATGIDNLSYEGTKQDFGFDSKRVKYTVAVQVADDPTSSSSDGDCGSQNQFYFQLVFQNEDGDIFHSSYVLSNQQLQGDGFRTNSLEQFVIYTNDDYGTPIQINIVPDDTSSDSDVFDKLNIDWISVSRTSSTGVNLSWKAEEVGWIDISYKDDSETTSGRTADELVRSFALEDGGYNVTLEFGIQTAPDYFNGQQFVGQMEAIITYRDGENRVQTTSGIDVVDAIADYINKTELLGDTPASGTQISLPDYMFQKGYTNRFQVNFSDIRSLVRIKLKVTANENMTWRLSDVFARQVFDEGTLSYNIFNEYERSYSITPQVLCSASSSTSGIRNISLTAGEPVYITLDFDAGNSIKVSLTEDQESVQVETGEAEGASDIISVTATMIDTTGVSEGAVLPATIIYKNIYGNAFKVSTQLVFNSTTQQFMVPSGELPSTPYLAIPYQVDLTGSSGTDGVAISKVTINQIRDDQSISRFDFIADDDVILEKDKTTTLYYTSSQQDEYAQELGLTSDSEIVYLELGEKTEKTLLTASRDLSVALVYTEENDPYSYEHMTSYVSLLSSGYSTVEAGDVLKVNFDAANVGSVKYILLKSSDSTMNIYASRACVAVYEISDISGDTLSGGWASMHNAGGLITTAGVKMEAGANSLTNELTSGTRLSPVNVKLGISQVGRSDACLKITLHYVDSSNQQQSVEISASAAQLQREDTWIMVEGLRSVLYYEIESYDKDTSNLAKVILESVDIGWYDTEANYISTNNSGSWEVVEGLTISGSAVNVMVKGIVLKKDYAGYTSSAQSEPKKMTTLEFNAKSTERTDYTVISASEKDQIIVQGVLDGYPEDLQIILTDADTGEVLADTEGETNSYIYAYPDETLTEKGYDLSRYISVPANPTLETKRYEVQVVSKSVPESYCSIFYIDVAPASIDGFVMMDTDLLLEFETDGSEVSEPLYVSSGSTLKLHTRIINDADGVSVSLVNTATKESTSITTSKIEDNYKVYTLEIPSSASDQTYEVVISSETTPSLSYTLTIDAAKVETDVTSEGILFLELGNGTEGTLSATRDIQVAVTYVAENETTARTTSYVSAYANGGTSISNGTVLRIPVEMMGVSQICSVTVKTTGSGMSVYARNACMQVESTDNRTGAVSTAGWVNFPGTSQPVSTSGVTLGTDGASLTSAMSASDRLSPVKLQTVISDTDRSSTTMKLTLYYRTVSGEDKSVTRTLNMADWNNGGIWVMTKGFKSIQCYTLEASDSDSSNTATVDVTSVTLGWYDTSGTYVTKKDTVNATVTEGTVLPRLTPNITGTVTFSYEDGTASQTEALYEGASYTVPMGSDGYVALTVEASLREFPGEIMIELYQANGSSKTLVTYHSDEEHVALPTFVIPQSSAGVYYVKVYSKLFPNDVLLLSQITFVSQ